MHSPAKTGTERIITVDILRGIALSGILIVHITFWYATGSLPGHVFSTITDIPSKVVDFISYNFLAARFFGIFSLLFGLSFFIQMRSMENKRINFSKRFSWRLFWLFAIGAVHGFFWIGDILAIYAILGFFLLMMRKWSDKLILILGLLLASNITSKLIIAGIHLFPSGDDAVRESAKAAASETYYNMVKSGGWLEMITYNIENIPQRLRFQLFSGRVFVTMGYFLLGMYIGRKRWFADKSARPVFGTLFKGSLVVLFLTLIVTGAVTGLDRWLHTGWLANSNFSFIFSYVYDIQGMGLVAFYVTGITLLLYADKWQSRLSFFGYVGKMALTNYLLQTIFGIFLFYNVGCGLFEKTTPFMNFGIGILFFLFQVLFSKWWLGYFNYGPMEYLWRSATFMKWQSFRKAKPSSGGE